MGSAVMAMASAAQEVTDSLHGNLQEVVVTQRRGIRKLNGVTNTDLISASELKRAACCNLGESFTTNPSVDVNYTDAATGARQIRLLDLSGSYVQMLTENIPFYPDMCLWQFDVSCAVNGPGRMPTPYRMAGGEMSWSSRYKSFVQLNAQFTRNFRHWSVYIGGENLTNYRQPNPIIGASDPWGKDFDATIIYGPLHGAMVYAGFRYNITKYL